MRLHMGKAEAISSIQWGQGTSDFHIQLNGWEKLLSVPKYFPGKENPWEEKCINEDVMWRRERQREEGCQKVPLPSYIGPREKLSLRSSNSLAVQSGCLSPTQVKRKKDARERTQAEGNC